MYYLLILTQVFGLTGIKAAAPLLFELFELVGGKSIVEENFGAPEAICAESGMRAHNNCNGTVMMQLPEYMNAEPSCTFHQLINLDENELFQVNSSCYPVAKMKHVS
ncbi:MAG: penicillin-binding protein 1C [Cyclobacteriaceae bacterium]|jgi:penicillin-binding protein 1C